MSKRCAYQGNRIIEIESREDAKDEYNYAINTVVLLRDKADCKFNAIDGKEFCIFHDPDYWKEHTDEVAKKFLEELNKGESFFIGFHLPNIVFPKVINQELHMELAKFHGLLIARETEFKSNVSFNGAKFNLAMFYRAKFNNASFDGANFDTASFSDTEFKNNVSFFLAKFDSVNFINAKFNDALFVMAKFNNDAAFTAAEFNKVSFSSAKFKGNVLFDEAKFNDAAFTAAEFNKVSFDDATFYNRVSFENSTFKEVSFKNSKFLINLSNSKHTYYISFRRINFEEPTRVIFDNCNIKRISFIHTDISRVVFRNIDWGKDFRIFDEKLLLLKLNKNKEFIKEQKGKYKRIIDMELNRIIDKFMSNDLDNEIKDIIYEPIIYERLKLMKSYKDENKEKEYNNVRKELESYYNEYIDKLKNRIKTIDNDIEYEIKNIKGDEDLTLDNVLTVYRNLRDNYDNNMRYEESGKFFINEMKLKRITMKLSIEKFVMFVYEKLALYGESYVRPLLAIIAIMMISFIIRLYIINQFNLDTIQFNLDTIVDELIKSTDIFFTNRVDIDNITVIERLTSIPLFGMLIVALRRKLERRIRR